MAQQTKFMDVSAVTLLVITAGAVAATGWHWLALRSALKESNRIVAAAESNSTQSLLQGFALPVNQRLSLCNRTQLPVKVVALTAMYWGADGKLVSFNSAEHDWHEWGVESGNKEDLRLDDAHGDGWDGSAIFYAAEIQRANKETSLLSGTLNAQNGGCVAVVTE
jgi:hypothetical protein